MHRRFFRAMLAAAALWALAGGAQAKPAPWYWWVSQHDGQRVCAQVMPAQGWRRGEGPFPTAQCRPQRAALIHSR